MAQLTVRNVDEAVARALRLRAAAHGRSAEAEVRAILEQTLCPQARDFWDIADRLRAETAGRAASDSTDLIREERDRRTSRSD